MQRNFIIATNIEVIDYDELAVNIHYYDETILQSDSTSNNKVKEAIATFLESDALPTKLQYGEKQNIQSYRTMKFLKEELHTNNVPFDVVFSENTRDGITFDIITFKGIVYDFEEVIFNYKGGIAEYIFTTSDIVLLDKNALVVENILEHFEEHLRDQEKANAQHVQK